MSRRRRSKKIRTFTLLAAKRRSVHRHAQDAPSFGSANDYSAPHNLAKPPTVKKPVLPPSAMNVQNTARLCPSATAGGQM